MTLTEKAAYLKGLTEGLGLDSAKPETKIINELIALVEDMSRTIADLEEDVEYLNDYIEEVDEDLGTLEEDFYSEIATVAIAIAIAILTTMRILTRNAMRSNVPLAARPSASIAQSTEMTLFAPLVRKRSAANL